MSAAEDVGAFFCDHDRRCVGVAAGHVRHDRGIDHTQRGDTSHAQIRVDNRAPIIVDAHLARADGMLGDGADPTYEGLEIGIGLDIASRLELLADKAPRRGRPRHRGRGPFRAGIWLATLTEWVPLALILIALLD